MDKGTKILVAVGVLGGAWWVFNKDKTPLARSEDAANQGDKTIAPDALGPHGPDWYSPENAANRSDQTTPDWQVTEEGPHGPDWYAQNPVVGSGIV